MRFQIFFFVFCISSMIFDGFASDSAPLSTVDTVLAKNFSILRKKYEEKLKDFKSSTRDKKLQKLRGALNENITLRNLWDELSGRGPIAGKTHRKNLMETDLIHA